MLTQEQLTMMAENVARIRENMAAAAREAGRDPADILLCAACKTRTVEEVIASAVLPIDLFGENHVQELVEKTDANAYCGKPGHFIGHLQTNKVNKVVGRAALIESVDSEHLLQKVERAAAAANFDRDQHRRGREQVWCFCRKPVAPAGYGSRTAAYPPARPDGHPAGSCNPG